MTLCLHTNPVCQYHFTYDEEFVMFFQVSCEGLSGSRELQNQPVSQRTHKVTLGRQEEEERTLVRPSHVLSRIFWCCNYCRH